MADSDLYIGTKGISSDDFTKTWEAFAEGVLDADSFEVTAGAIGLSVDVAPGTAFVLDDDQEDKTLRRMHRETGQNSNDFADGGLEADADDPRISRIVLRIYVGDEVIRREVVHGTPAAVPVAPDIPDSAMPVAQVALDAGQTSVAAEDITDERPDAWSAFPAGPPGEDGTLSSRGTDDHTTASLADGALEDCEFTLAPTAAILVIETDVEARVVLYATDADRDADDLTTRAFGTDPTGDHGVHVDLLAVGGGEWRKTPAAVVFNGDGSPTSTIYATVVNESGSTDTVTVTITFVPLEA